MAGSSNLTHTSAPSRLATPEGWHPLLEGALARAAEAALEEIVGALRRLELTDPSVAGGAAGLAVLEGWLCLAGWPTASTAALEARVEQATDALTEQTLPYGLFSGFTGIAWVLNLLQEQLWGRPAEDTHEEIDQALLELTAQRPWPGHFDLISGLVGLGVYAQDRLEFPTARQLGGQVATRLGELAAAQFMGLAWPTPPAHLPPHQRALAPMGWYDLGVAHGTAGVIAWLARTVAAARTAALPLGPSVAQLEDWLTAAVTWLLAQRLPDEGASPFPAAVSPGTPPGPCRTAWCYGGPGIATALLAAARVMRQLRWEDAARELARKAAATRTEQETGIVDAGLCHGAAGLGHLLNRQYQATGEPDLRAGAAHWLGEALRLRRPGQGVAGFEEWIPQVGTAGAGAWVPAPGLLTGAAGVALALLAALRPVEPSWDRLLLVDLPRLPSSP